MTDQRTSTVTAEAYRRFPDDVEPVDYHPAGKITVDRGNLRYAFLAGAEWAKQSSRPAQPSAVTEEADPLADLVARFSRALLAKLRLAQANGRSGWEHDDWEAACQKGLLRHVEKGDPRDVAAYCAFMWHHGWITSIPSQPSAGTPKLWQDRAPNGDWFVQTEHDGHISFGADKDSAEQCLRALCRVSAQGQPGSCNETAVNCARFVRWALQEGSWQGSDLDGDSVQDKAESLGLIVPVPYDPEKHGEYNSYGCDAGEPWFEFSLGLNAIKASAFPSTDDKSPAPASEKRE